MINILCEINYMFYIVDIVTVNHINIGIWLYRKRVFVQQRKLPICF